MESSIVTKLYDLSPILALMAIIIGALWYRLNDRENKLETRLSDKDTKVYELHDKATTALTNNTIALNNLTEIIKQQKQ